MLLLTDKCNLKEALTMINALVVSERAELPKVKEYKTMNQLLGEIGVKKQENGTYSPFETMLLNEHDPDFDGIGVIGIDQDITDKKENLLGIKGKFLVVGMKRIEPNTETNTHIFESLTDEQISVLKKRFTQAIAMKVMRIK